MKKALLAGLLCFCFGFTFGQSNGSYRSRQSGDWNQVSTWQVFNSGWNDLESPGAGIYQNSIPSNTRGVILIASGTIVSIPGGLEVDADQLEFGPNGTLHVAANGILNIRPGAGDDIRLYNDGTNFSQLLVSGYLRLHKNTTMVNDNYAGTVIPASNATTFNTYKVLNGGVHIHASAVALPYADWQTGSTLTFYATNANPIIDDLSIQFYNFVWDGREQSQNMHFFGRLRNVAGHLTIFDTNGRTLNFATNTAYTLNIGRNFSLLGNGQVYLTNSSSAVLNIGSISSPGNLQVTSGTLVCAINGATTLNISGGIGLTGGTVSLRTQTDAGGGVTNLNVIGDFFQTGGAITRSVAAGTANINFTGAGTTSTFTKTGGSIVNAINFTVTNGKTLDLGTFALTGSGSFTALNGSIIHLKALDALGAIQNNTTGGNIRVSGTRTFQAGSTLVYNGADTQFMGAGHPSTANTRTENPNMVYMVSNVTINGTLSTPLPLIIDGNTLTIGGEYQRENGYIGITTTSNLIINGTGHLNDLLLAPVQSTSPPNAMNNLTINRFGTVRLVYDLIVGGTCTLTSGTLLIGQPFGFSLTLRGDVVRTSGSLIVENNPNLTIEGTGTLPATFPITFLPNSYLGQLTMNRPSATFTTNSVVTMDTLNLFNGTVNNPSSNLTMRSAGLVVRRSGGSVTQALGAVDSYDVHYQVNTNITSGNELPNAATTLRDLFKTGTASVTLAKDIVINGRFTIDEGIFDAGVNNDITLRENLVVDGTFVPRQGLVTFAGGAAQTVSGANPVAFFDVAVNQTPASTVTLSTPVDVANNLAINSSSTLNAGNQLLLLQSTAARTANVSALPAGALINGSVIVQRHLPKIVSRRHYFHIASPVVGSTLADWNTEVPIYLAYQWNEVPNVYEKVGLSTPTLSGKGFTVDFNTLVSSTVDTRGSLRQGTLSVPVTTQSPGVVEGQDGWNLLGNPYPSAIDWDNIVLPAGVYDAVYVWDNFGNSGQGPEPAKLVSYVDGVGTPNGFGGEIAQGQAFWVKATANATFTFTESAKSLVTDASFYRKPEIPNILRITLKGSDIKDETVIRLREGATGNFDGKYDAYKYLTEGFRISTLTEDNVKAVINAFGTSSCDRTVQLVAEEAQKGSYTLDFNGMESFESFISISLFDAVEKKTIDIRNQPVYAFTIADENIELMDTRFLISLGANVPPVNTAIAATGETLCEDNSIARIMLDSSEPGVQYSVEWQGTKISEPVTGTGSSLQLDVNTGSLSFGENNVTVRAQAGVCAGSVLTSMPVITKVKRGEIKSVQDGNVCGQGSVTLRASGADTGGWYQWYESSDAAQPITGQQGDEFLTPSLIKSRTYYVAVVNALGCEGERKPVAAVVSYPEDEVSLTSEGFILTSSAAEGNQWYLNGELLEEQTSNTIEAVRSGLYTVIVSNGACKSTASIEMTGLEEESDMISVFPNPAADKVYIRIKTDNNNVTATMVNSQGVELGTKDVVGENGIKEAEFDLLPYSTGMYNVRVLDGRKVVIKKIAKIR